MRRPAAAAVRGFPGARLEVKPAGIAFHDRKVPARALAELRRRIRHFLASQDLEGIDVLRGRRVVELRPAGHHKGMVVGSLPLPRGSDRRDASLVALGDDRTDEDLFRAIRGRGLAVRVGRPGKRTLARRRLASPKAVQRFLRALGDRVESALLLQASRPRRARRGDVTRR
jgi:trehalose-phosphatase